MYEWDEAKRRTNRAKHGLDFADAAGFDWPSALLIEDDGAGERRVRAIGWIGETLVAMIYTERGDAVRVISLRKASRAERKAYGNG